MLLMGATCSCLYWKMMAQQVTSMVGFQTGREVHEVEEGKVVLVVVMVVVDSHQVMKVGITSDEVVGVVVVVVVEVVAVVGQVAAQGLVAVAGQVEGRELVEAIG